MGIYIPGLKMPSGGYRTVEITFNADGYPMALADGGDVFDVIPVPPHGDMIDVEVLLEGILSIMFQRSDDPKKVTINANTLLQLVDSLPTIIPADDCKEANDG